MGPLPVGRTYDKVALATTGPKVHARSEVTAELKRLLTTEPNAELGAVGPAGAWHRARVSSSRSGMWLFVKFAAGLAALYLIVVALIALAQDWLLFPRWAIGEGAILPGSAERLAIEVPSGATLVGVRLPAERKSPAETALVLAFGGNAWSADVLAVYLHSVIADRDVVAFHYRGYGPSTGHPSARALLQDAVSIHDHLAGTLGSERVVVVGLSIGAGPAAYLASQRPISGLILVTPFDSLAALAREHYPWAPVGLLLRHRMQVADALASSSAPVAIISAERDTVVPARRTAPVRRAARDIVLDRVIGDAGHNDLYDRTEFKRALREALSLVEGTVQGRP